MFAGFSLLGSLLLGLVEFLSRGVGSGGGGAWGRWIGEVGCVALRGSAWVVGGAMGW